MTDDDFIKWDPLREYHLKNRDQKTYEIIYNLVHELESLKKSPNAINKSNAIKNIDKTLGVAESSRILHLICQKQNLSYNKIVLEITDKVFGGELPIDDTYLPRLILRLLCHMETYADVGTVADFLDIDDDQAKELLEQLKLIFVIDSPLIWLNAFLKSTSREQDYQKTIEDNARLGINLNEKTEQKDTSEARKNKQRKLNLIRKLRNIFGR